jgi:hypothetical protein
MKTVAEPGKERWEHAPLEPALAKSPERAASFTTISGGRSNAVYGGDVERSGRPRSTTRGLSHTRGIHPTGYRGSRDAPVRWLRDAGRDQRLQSAAAGRQHKLSVAFDLPC